jgi:hypothetical protein
MKIIFDTATNKISIDTSDAQPAQANIQALLDRHGNVINLRGFEMLITVLADGDSIFNLHLPPHGVRYQNTDQDLLAHGQAQWFPDQKITVRAWCKTNDGHEAEANATFIVPRPPQPFPSWTWQEGGWTAPKKRPAKGNYGWDEEKLKWVKVSESEE